MSSAMIVANLSIPISDEEKIKEALHASLQWEYGKYLNPIQSLFLLTPQIAVVYTSSELSTELLSRGNVFQLGGPLSATFSDATELPSNCCEVKFNSEIIEDTEYLFIERIKESYPTVSIFLRKNSLLLKFIEINDPSSVISTLSSIISSSGTIRIIPLTENILVKCAWRGSVPFTTTVKRLKSTGQNITNLVQSCLSVWPLQPLILAVLSSRPRDSRESPARDSPSPIENDDVTIVCATQADADIVTSAGSIDIIGGSSIIVKSKDDTRSSGSSPETESINFDIYILWDYDSCPLNVEENAGVVTDILCSTLLNHCTQNSRFSHMGGRDSYGKELGLSHRTAKLLFLSADGNGSNRPTSLHMKDLHEKGFRGVSYNQASGGVEAAMKAEVDAFAPHRANGPNSDVCVCVLTSGSQEFSPVLANLRLLGMTNSILVHSHVPRPTLASLTVRMISWSLLRSAHTVAPQHREEYLSSPGPTAFGRLPSPLMGALDIPGFPGAPGLAPSPPVGALNLSGLSGMPAAPGFQETGPSSGGTWLSNIISNVDEPRSRLSNYLASPKTDPVASPFSMAPSPVLGVMPSVGSLGMPPGMRGSFDRGESPMTGRESISSLTSTSSLSGVGYGQGGLGQFNSAQNQSLQFPLPPSQSPSFGSGLSGLTGGLPPHPMEGNGAATESFQDFQHQQYLQFQQQLQMQQQHGHSTTTISPTPGSRALVRSTSSTSNEVIIDLQWLSVATHFRNLMAWGQEEYDGDEEIDEAEAMSIRTGRGGRATPSMTAFPLLGERDGPTAESGYEEEQLNTTVAVTIDSKAKNFKLKISGANPEDVDRRYRRLEGLVAAALKDRKLHTLAGWEPQHRECIMGAHPLHQEERESQATALFHYNEGTIIAEIVAVNPRRHRSMWRFLESLGPRQAFWTIPRECLEIYQKRQWSDIKVQFAVVVDKEQQPTTTKLSSSKAPNVAMRVWGFGALLDQALAQVLTTASNSSVTAKASLSSQLSLLNMAAETPLRGVIAAARSVSTKSFHGSFVFQDREAGIFYQTFEDEFRRHIAHAFNVDISETAQPGIVDSTAAPAAAPVSTKGRSGSGASVSSSSTSATGAVRAPALRVDFAGSTQREVASCRAYLEQLNTTNLMRHQIYFPRTDAARYKDLLDHKTKQDATLRNVRRLEMSTSTGVSPTATLGEFPVEGGDNDRPVDPLDTDGFINIRIKPPLHSRGIKRMTLPADVTITICGPARTEQQGYTLRMMEQYFESIDSDHFTALVEIPTTSALARTLTVRTSREEFIITHGLVGLRFEEGSRSSGVAGTAKIWTTSKLAIDTVLRFIDSNGGQSVQTVQVKKPLVALPFSPSTISEAPSISPFASGPSAVQGFGLTPHTQTQFVAPTGQVEEWDQLKSIIGRHSDLLPQVLAPHPGQSPSVLDQISRAKSSPNPNNETSVIRWPHPSFRFMFLGETLKKSLNDLLESLRNTNGILTTCPYRDKTDQSACLLLEGTPGTVGPCADRVNAFMRSVAQQMRCVQVVLSEGQRKILMAGDLAKVKEVQGTCGVHLVLDPQPTDLSEATSSYDIRLPCSETAVEVEVEVPEPESGPQSLDVFARSFRPPTELISIVVTSKVSNHPVLVSVMNNKASVGGWNWGVSNLLLVLDATADAGLNPIEIDQLNRGEVLVNAEAATGRRILRVRPELNYMGQRGVERQAESLVAALSRGLAAADSLSLTGVAVVAPLMNQCFSDLPVELVRSLTVEALVAFIHRAPVRVLERILCIEILPVDVNVDAPSEYVNPFEASILLPAGGDRMAMTMLLLLEQANDRLAQATSAASHSYGSSPPAPSIRLHACNIPLTRTFAAESLVPPPQPRHFLQLQPQLPPGPAGPIIVRGLARSLVAALKAIRKAASGN